MTYSSVASCSRKTADLPGAGREPLQALFVGFLNLLMPPPDVWGIRGDQTAAALRPSRRPAIADRHMSLHSVQRPIGTVWHA